MTHVGYLVAGWGVSLAVIGLYARYVITKGRELTPLVPADKRRWTQSDGVDHV